jgi:UPF0755 protein
MKRYQINLRKKEFTRYFLALTFFVLIFYIRSINAPNTTIQYPHTFRIEQGETLSMISQRLKQEQLITSRSFFNIQSLIRGQSDSLKSGVYIFKTPLSTTDIINRFAEGKFDIETIQITFPEGATREEIAAIASKSLPSFDINAFMLETREGYLFPDTYRFFETASAQDVKNELEKVFAERMKILEEEIDLSGRTKDEIIIMASIIEKEANTPESRRIVADILWRRINNEMPLQVDATFVYSIGKGTFDLTVADLEEDAPYNTYVRKGLPPTAISNPGLDTIRAAIYPTDTEYLFFLTGADGEMYYAETFEGHKENRRKYLN